MAFKKKKKDNSGEGSNDIWDLYFYFLAVDQFGIYFLFLIFFINMIINDLFVNSATKIFLF